LLGFLNIITAASPGDPATESDRGDLAIEAIASGGMVIIPDSDSHESEGDPIAFASTATPDWSSS
jgi:3,4-dihydroxy-2-butanone 4-phosphate synthase